MNKYTKALRHATTSGMLAVVALQAMFQDYLGLDSYIVYLQKWWISLPWAIWIPVLLFALWLRLHAVKVMQGR